MPTCSDSEIPCPVHPRARYEELRPDYWSSIAERLRRFPTEEDYSVLTEAADALDAAIRVLKERKS